jgi:hypothetical protein
LSLADNVEEYFAFWTVHFLKINKKTTTNAVILLCIATQHSPTRFSTLKCHHQGVNHDPAEIGAQCCRNLKDRLKYIVKNHRIYINGTKWALVEYDLKI